MTATLLPWGVQKSIKVKRTSTLHFEQVPVDAVKKILKSKPPTKRPRPRE
jgi:hypothetical protein